MSTHHSAVPISIDGARVAATAAPATNDLACMLDALEYGMLLTDGEGRIRYSNALGRDELDDDGPLETRNGSVVARSPLDQARLRVALGNAARGRRQLLTFAAARRTVSIAFSPLLDGAGGNERVLMIFAKRPDSAGLAVDFYARSQGLTGAEAAVLTHLSHGLDPLEVAQRQGVAISTIRSQIASIRAKTGASSIRELLDHVAMLPPIRCVVQPSHRPSWQARDRYGPGPRAASDAC